MTTFKIYDKEFYYKEEFRPAKITHDTISRQSYVYHIYHKDKLIFQAGDTNKLTTLRIKNQFKRFLRIRGNSKNKYIIESELETLELYISK